MANWLGFDVTLARAQLEAAFRVLDTIGNDKKAFDAVKHTRITVDGQQCVFTAVDFNLAVQITQPCNATRPGYATVETAKFRQALATATGDTVRLRSTSIDHPDPDAPIKAVGLFDAPEPEPTEPSDKPVIKPLWIPIVNMVAGKSGWNFKGYDPDMLMDFPAIAVAPEQTTVALGQAAFVRALDSVNWIMPNDRTVVNAQHQVLVCTVVEQHLRVQTNNSFTCGRYEIPLDAGLTDQTWSCTLGMLSAIALQRVLQATLDPDPKHQQLVTLAINDHGKVMIHADNVIAVATQSDVHGQSLDEFFGKLENEQRMTLDRAALHTALLTVRPFHDKSGMVLFDSACPDASDTAMFTLATQRTEVGRCVTRIAVDPATPRVITAFNNPFLLRMVNAFQSQRITLTWTTLRSSQLLRVTAQDQLALCFILTPMSAHFERDWRVEHGLVEPEPRTGNVVMVAEEPNDEPEEEVDYVEDGMS